MHALKVERYEKNHQMQDAGEFFMYNMKSDMNL